MKLKKRELFEYTDAPKIDWISITSVRPKRLYTKELRKHEVSKILDIFKEFTFEPDPNGETYTSTDESIKIIINKTMIQPQFRGTYWTLYENGWEYFKEKFKKLLETNYQDTKKPEIENNWKITRIDIRRDYLQDWHEVLPINNEYAKKYYHQEQEYQFKYKCDSTLFEKKKIHTGIKYQSEHWQMAIYRKDIENQITKNKKKEKNQIYSQIIKDRIMTRVELRIDTGSANSYTNWMIRNREEISEEELSLEVLSKWSRNHRCMKNKKDLEERWEQHFNGIPSKKKYEKLELKEDNGMLIGRRFAKSFIKKYVEEGISLENAMAMIRAEYKAKINEQKSKQKDEGEATKTES